MAEYNIYCDESNHLENDGIPTMVLGSVYSPVEKVKLANQRIKEIKEKHKIKPTTEIKWKKVSANKLPFYLDIIDYFFDNDDLHFRAIIVNKDGLSHEKFKQTHDDFYYKMYFELLSKILDPQNKYFIYIDIKDTRGGRKVKKLWDVLRNDMYDFDGNIIKRIQQVHSDEVEVLQLADLLIGAMQFLNRPDLKSEAKKKVVERMRMRSGYDLLKSTLVRESKTNIFYWKGRDVL
ncbi:MAG: DUF3800 domain-containing protein [bacterium]|nr:DUF3800 domain-containing protein [bacterium]